jgi:hypothetical protein
MTTCAKRRFIRRNALALLLLLGIGLAHGQDLSRVMTLATELQKLLKTDGKARVPDSVANVILIPRDVAELNRTITELLSKMEEESIREKTPPFLLSGFIDVYSSYNFGSTASRMNTLRVFDTRNGQVDVNLAKVVLQHPAAPVGFRLDLAWGSSADIAHTVDGSIDQTFRFIHQAYLTAVIPMGAGLTVDAGKFMSPLGAEVVESNANWLYTRSFLFGYALPTFHVGVKLSYPVSNNLTLSTMLVNGYTRVADNNTGKTIGGSVVWVPLDGLTITQNVITGPEQKDNNGDIRTVWDAIVAWQANERLGFNVNYDYGSEMIAGSRAIWSGVSVMSRYAFNERVAIAMRGEWIEDRLGSQTGTPQELQEVTIGGEWRTQERLLLRLEIRRDWSNKEVFEGSNSSAPRGSQHTLTFGAVYDF